MAAAGKGALRIAIEDFLETFSLGKVLSTWFTGWGEEQETAVVETFSDILRTLDDVPDIPESVKLTRAIQKPGGGQGAIAGALGFGAQVGMSAASALLSPIMRLINYWMDRKMRTARVDPSVAFAIARRYRMQPPNPVDDLKDLGWSDDLIKAWDKITEPVLSEGELYRLWLKGDVTQAELDKELQARGWTDTRQDRLEKLTEIIPGVTDLVQMAVREAWNEEIVDRFQYDQDFPTEAAKWGKKIGLSEDWFRKYWRAHWALPGVSAGYTMLHRLRPGTTDDPFTIKDMQLLLRASDIPPFWRDRLIAIAYTPYTRVDVRRMYEQGVLNREGVLASYLDLGYNEEKAENMTEFTIRLATTDQRDLTRAAITGGYKRHILTKSAAIDSLVEIDYSQDDAEFYLSMIDYDLAQKLLDEQIDQAKFLFVSGEITESEVIDYLGPLNLPAEQTAALLREWNITIRKKIAIPTRSDLDDFYRRDIITLDAWREGMLKRRYTPETVDKYAMQLDQKLAAEAAAEIERAQKEQERLLAAEQATDYQKLKTGLDLQIAELRLELADIKVAIHFILAEIQVNEDLLRGETKEKQLDLRSERRYRQAVQQADTALEKATLLATQRGQAINLRSLSALDVVTLTAETELANLRERAETLAETTVLELNTQYKEDVIIIREALKRDLLLAETPDEEISLWTESKLTEVSTWFETQTKIIALVIDVETREVILTANTVLNEAKVAANKVLAIALLAAETRLKEELIEVTKADRLKRNQLDDDLAAALLTAEAQARVTLREIRVNLETALINRDNVKREITNLQVSKAQIRTELFE